jgi:ATP-dependent Clp protease adaptor protein ClpS
MIAMPVRMQTDSDGDGGKANRGTSVITRTQPKTKKPSLYRVLLLNDDYTPMEFVIHILERFFQKDREAATRSCCMFTITAWANAASSPTKLPKPK